MTSDEKKKGMIVKIGTKYKLCYYQQGDFGWCNIKQVPSMKDTSKPNWGYCSYHCHLPKKSFSDRPMSAAIR